MSLRYLEVSTLSFVARSAMRPELLLTTVSAIVGAVVLYGIFGLGGDDSFASILGDFLAVSFSFLWLMLGLVALAHQINVRMSQSELLPNTIEAYGFAMRRIQSLLLLPAWAVGSLLVIMLLEIMILSLANIPGLGTIWLALIALPLLIFNTGLAILLMMSVFNIAAYVTVFKSNLGSMRQELWQIIKSNYMDLAVYNLGGVLLTVILAALVLSPIWLGAQVSSAVIDYAAAEPWVALLNADGFWASIAHLIGLLMGGLVLAVVCAVPFVIITHITLLVHKDAKSDIFSSEPVIADAEIVSEDD